jgi:hypothetical protein
MNEEAVLDVFRIVLTVVLVVVSPLILWVKLFSAFLYMYYHKIIRFRKRGIIYYPRAA